LSDFKSPIMKRLLLLSGMFFILSFTVHAQILSPINSDQKGISISERCSTSNPVISLQLKEQQEKIFNDYVATHRDDLVKNKTAYTIPVVIHIIYKNAAENISDQRVQEQISRTNSDFAGLSTHSMGPFSDSLKANSNITFCLATIDPNGNPTNGITRTQTTKTSFNITASTGSCNGFPERCASTGGCDAWDVTKYLNIWVCNTGATMTGISEFPSSPNNAFYGSTINYMFFGLTGATPPYNEGATLTQQLGHCLDLYNLTGDNTCTDLDYCLDTPTEYGTQSTIGGGCIIDQCNTSCPGIMYMNFMSYSDDTTMANFTPDQVARMQACVTMYLSSVAGNSSTACSAPNPCSAHFTIYPDTATLHHYFAVNLASGVAPMHYLWSWGDGTNDTIAFPSHTYATAGYYNICLTITDSVGCTSNYCDSSYIQKSGNTVINVDVISQSGVGIHENYQNNVIQIRPNPALDNITIETASVHRGDIISIYNIQGQIMLQQPLKQFQTKLNISGFPRGSYILKVESYNGVDIKRFIKE